jgi:hypothetical protein
MWMLTGFDMIMGSENERNWYFGKAFSLIQRKSIRQ